MPQTNDKIRKYSILIGMILTIAIVLFIQTRASYEPTAGYGYSDLANALLEGRLYISENTDVSFSQLTNPYDYVAREVSGAVVPWDTAFYNNKFYVYFGIVPAILFYMPYKIITGNDMDDFQANCIIEVLLVMACFFIINELRKQYCKDISVKMQLLLSFCFSFSSGIVLMLKRISIYYIAISTGLLLVLYGIAIWLQSTNNNEVNIKKFLWIPYDGISSWMSSAVCYSKFFGACYI